MVLGILCNAWINTKEPVSYERESIHFLCELEEFEKKDNGYTLVVRDVKVEMEAMKRYEVGIRVGKSMRAASWRLL